MKNVYFRGCSYGGELARLGGLESSYGTWNLHVHMESSISVQSKFCYVAGRRLFDQVVFTVNSDVKPSCRANVPILFN